MKRRTLDQKLMEYELALMAIGNLPHDCEIEGPGALREPLPCPTCVAWCALNPEKAEERLRIAHDIIERDKANRELGLGKNMIEVVKG